MRPNVGVRRERNNFHSSNRVNDVCSTRLNSIKPTLRVIHIDYTSNLKVTDLFGITYCNEMANEHEESETANKQKNAIFWSKGLSRFKPKALGASYHQRLSVDFLPAVLT